MQKQQSLLGRAFGPRSGHNVRRRLDRQVAMQDFQLARATGLEPATSGVTGRLSTGRFAPVQSEIVVWASSLRHVFIPISSHVSASSSNASILSRRSDGPQVAQGSLGLSFPPENRVELG